MSISNKQRLGDTSVNIQTKIHIKAFSEVFELVLIGSMLALIADTCWVIHDIVSNGLSWQYVGIFTGLFSASVLTAIACVKHHKNNFGTIYHNLLDSKLKIQRCINRHNREK